MQRKTVLVLGLAAVTVMLLVAVSAVTVFALVGETAAQPDKVEVVPARAEPASEPLVAEPVVRYEHSGYSGKAGCSYESRLQMTEAPAEKIDDQLLTQAVE